MAKSLSSSLSVPLPSGSGWRHHCASSLKLAGKALALEADGSLYSCDHFVYPEHRLGSIKDRRLLEMVTSTSQTVFGVSKACHTAGILQQVRIPFRLSRRMPEKQICQNARRRTGTELPLPRTEKILLPYRSIHENACRRVSDEKVNKSGTHLTEVCSVIQVTYPGLGSPYLFPSP